MGAAYPWAVVWVLLEEGGSGRDLMQLVDRYYDSVRLAEAYWHSRGVPRYYWGCDGPQMTMRFSSVWAFAEWLDTHPHERAEKIFLVDGEMHQGDQPNYVIWYGDAGGLVKDRTGYVQVYLQTWNPYTEIMKTPAAYVESLLRQGFGCTMGMVGSAHENLKPSRNIKKHIPMNSFTNMREDLI